MADLNLTKMQELKKAKKYTYAKIAELADVPKSTIEKIFSGANTNPTLNYIQKIAEVLNCSIDDFVDYKTAPTSPYTMDRNIKEIAYEIYNKPDLRGLLYACKNLSSDDIKAVIAIVNRIK